MEVIKTTSNMEFDVIYADGTHRRVEEGILHEVIDGEIIFHKGTGRFEVLTAAAEDLLKYLRHIGPGLKKLAFDMCLSEEAAKALWELTAYTLQLMDPERPVKQAIFRLGQMDMKESIIDMLQHHVDQLDNCLPRATLQAAIDEIRKMEVSNENA